MIGCGILTKKCGLFSRAKFGILHQIVTKFYTMIAISAEDTKTQHRSETSGTCKREVWAESW